MDSLGSANTFADQPLSERAARTPSERPTCRTPPRESS